MKFILSVHPVYCLYLVSCLCSKINVARLFSLNNIATEREGDLAYKMGLSGLLQNKHVSLS